MKRRGFIGGWQNRRFVSKSSGYGPGSTDPEIPDDTKGEFVNYMTGSIRGRGWDYYIIEGDEEEDDELVEFLSDIVYVSPPFIADSGECYRYAQTYHRDDDDNQLDVYSLMLPCTSRGSLRPASRSSYMSIWDANIGSPDRRYIAFLLYKTSETGSILINENPFCYAPVFDIIVNESNDLYGKVIQSDWRNVRSTQLFDIYDSGRFLSSHILVRGATGSTGAAVVSRAMSLSGFKYWYGAAGQTATLSLATSLRSSYPGIWTQSYYEKALNDIGQRVGDCSYLVNYAYGRASEGLHGSSTSDYPALYQKWSGTPRDGMILWRSGHAGIYSDGHSIELTGINTDFQVKPYNKSDWQAIFYDSNYSY